jgi:hypothetical protein
MISGRWDFAGVLFAASGFLLFGGPAVLTGLYDQWRLAWLLGQTRFLQGVGDHWTFWLGVWGGYFLLILAWSGYFLSRSGRITSIYNVEPAAFAQVFARCLEARRIETVTNRGSRLVLRYRDESGVEKFGSAAAATVGVDIDSFSFMQHVTLRWSRCPAALRSEVETDLAAAFADISTPPHPVAQWLQSAAVMLFMIAGLIALTMAALRVVSVLR